MPTTEQLRRYAELIVNVGANVQTGQSVQVRADSIHRDFALMLAEAAYDAGAKFVRVTLTDPRVEHARLKRVPAEYLDYLPASATVEADEMAADGWAEIIITGAEFPDLFDDVDAALIRRAQTARVKSRRALRDLTLSRNVQWTIAAAPTPRWAAKLFPAQSVEDAVAKLWALILSTSRADQPDAVARSQAHFARLDRLRGQLNRANVRELHLFDPAVAEDGKPSTDLRIGLADKATFATAMATTARGIRHLRNIPSEEVFTAPHNLRAEGYARTSRPSTYFNREARDAYFRFAGGEMVEFRARVGQDVFEQFFQYDGARRLGEIALVDVDSPIFQAGVVFNEILFDENAACHMAFGRAVTDCIEDHASKSEAEMKSLGANFSDVHWDVMIGTPTMNIDGVTASGDDLPIMREGRFVIDRE